MMLDLNLYQKLKLIRLISWFTCDWCNVALQEWLEILQRRAGPVQTEEPEEKKTACQKEEEEEEKKEEKAGSKEVEQLATRLADWRVMVEEENKEAKPWAMKHFAFMFGQLCSCNSVELRKLLSDLSAVYKNLRFSILNAGAAFK